MDNFLEVCLLMRCEYITYEEFVERRTAEAYDEVADRTKFYESGDRLSDLWLLLREIQLWLIEF